MTLLRCSVHAAQHHDLATLWQHMPARGCNGVMTTITHPQHLRGVLMDTCCQPTACAPAPVGRRSGRKPVQQRLQRRTQRSMLAFERTVLAPMCPADQGRSLRWLLMTSAAQPSATWSCPTRLEIIVNHRNQVCTHPGVEPRLLEICKLVHRPLIFGNLYLKARV
jgi:hypothetical protein